MKQYTFEDYMMPILIIMEDGKVKENFKIRDDLITNLKLDGDVLEERSRNGHLKYADNINFALSYLQMAGLLIKPGRGKFKISNKGLDAIKKGLKRIDTEYLKSISEDFKSRVEGGKKTSSSAQSEPNLEELNPNELIERGEIIIRNSVKSDILSSLLNSSPAFFEKVVVNLINAMGYGFGEKSGFVLGRSHDSGIDGAILEDKLGLSKIYLQAKRYKPVNSIGRPEIQKFVGSLLGVTKAIFITTSSFSQEAIEYSKSLQSVSLALIDSEKLLDLMYDFNVGVSIDRKIEIKTINTDYFSELI
jgi:restriction system protein